MEVGILTHFLAPPPYITYFQRPKRRLSGFSSRGGGVGGGEALLNYQQGHNTTPWNVYYSDESLIECVSLGAGSEDTPAEARKAGNTAPLGCLVLIR